MNVGEVRSWEGAIARQRKPRWQCSAAEQDGLIGKI